MLRLNRPSRRLPRIVTATERQAQQRVPRLRLLTATARRQAQPTPPHAGGNEDVNANVDYGLPPEDADVPF